MQKKSMNSPDETRSFDNGKAEITTLANGVTIGIAYIEPGWSWEKCIKPIAKTEYPFATVWLLFHLCDAVLR